MRKDIIRLLGAVTVTAAVLLSLTGFRASAAVFTSDAAGQVPVPEGQSLETYTVGENSTDYSSDLRNNLKTWFVTTDAADTSARSSIWLKKGSLTLMMYGNNGAGGGASGTVTLYDDNNYTSQVGRLTLSPSRVDQNSGSYYGLQTITITRTQTYYIEITNTSGGYGRYQLSTWRFSGMDDIITPGRKLAYIDPKIGSVNYNIHVDQDGTLSFAPRFLKNESFDTTDGQVTMQLLDDYGEPVSVARAIGSTEGSFASKAVYGVKQGDYILRINSPGQQLVELNTSVKAVRDRSGSSKKKARVMKNKKWYSGLVTWDDTSSHGDYYKFTLKKAARVKVSIKGDVTTGRINASVLSDSISRYKKLYINTVGASKTWNIKTSDTSFLPRGTYYLRFHKDTKKTSGSYKVRVKYTYKK